MTHSLLLKVDMHVSIEMTHSLLLEVDTGPSLFLSVLIRILKTVPHKCKTLKCKLGLPENVRAIKHLASMR